VSCTDRDLAAIASWMRHDQGDDIFGGGAPVPYVCVDCEWTGGTRSAMTHHKETGHAVRGKGWPTHMGNARFSDAGPDGRRKERNSA
jgi:hypothetical protein